MVENIRSSVAVVEKSFCLAEFGDKLSESDSGFFCIFCAGKLQNSCFFCILRGDVFLVINLLLF